MMIAEAARALVLVVDDDASMRTVLRHMLELEGWRVVEAEDGSSGLEAWRTYGPDLVLTDLEMPVLSGEAMARRIRDGEADGDRVPVVAISRRAPEDGTDGLFDAVLRKPVTRRQLVSFLER